MDKFDISVLIKYIKTTVSQVRKMGKSEYVFFWHNVDDLAWQHYIIPDRIDAERPAQREYQRNTWIPISNSNYLKAQKQRKIIQILLACDFLNIPRPSPRKLSTITKESWLEFLRKWISSLK